MPRVCTRPSSQSYSWLLWFKKCSSKSVQTGDEFYLHSAILRSVRWKLFPPPSISMHFGHVNKQQIKVGSELWNDGSPIKIDHFKLKLHKMRSTTYESRASFVDECLSLFACFYAIMIFLQISMSEQNFRKSLFQGHARLQSTRRYQNIISIFENNLCYFDRFSRIWPLNLFPAG